jgi:hypothetical protein
MNEMHGIQPGAVLEVGSRDYNGTPRDLFAGAEYVGIDTKAGTGVDMVLSVYELSQLFQGAAFDAVLALNVLEHLDNIWAALIELGKALKVGIMLDYEILSLEHAKTQWGKHPMIHCLGRKCLP